MGDEKLFVVGFVALVIIICPTVIIFSLCFCVYLLCWLHCFEGVVEWWWDQELLWTGIFRAIGSRSVEVMILTISSKNCNFLTYAFVSHLLFLSVLSTLAAPSKINATRHHYHCQHFGFGHKDYDFVLFRAHQIIKIKSWVFGGVGKQLCFKFHFKFPQS